MALALAVASSSLAFSCQGGDKPDQDLAEPTAQRGEVDPDLLSLFPPADTMPVDGLIALREASGAVGNAQTARDTLDPEDTLADVRTRGRVRGYRVTYVPGPEWKADDRHFDELQLHADLFEDADGASEWMDTELDELVGYMSSGSAGSGIEVEESLFITGVTNHTRGIRLSSAEATTWIVAFQEGPLLGTVVLTRSDSYDAMLDASKVAGILLERARRVMNNQGVGDRLTFVSGSSVTATGGGALGIRCSTASKFLRERYGLPSGRGCVVLRVRADSGADVAGMMIGDKIVELDGVPITSGQQFTYRFEVGADKAVMNFVVERAGARLSLRIELSDVSSPPLDDPYADYLIARGNSDRGVAIEYFSRAIEQDPDFDLAHAYRGGERWALGDGDPISVAAAEADLLRALDLDPDLSEAHWVYARLLASQYQRYDDAVAHMNAAIAAAGCENPVPSWDFDCGEFLITRAMLYAERKQDGDFDMAELDLTASENVSGMAARHQEAVNGVFNARLWGSTDSWTCSNGQGTEVPCEWEEYDPTATAARDQEQLEAAWQAVRDNPNSARARFDLAGALGLSEGTTVEDLLELTEAAMELAGCVGDSREWAHECGEYVLGRARLYQIRNGPGDLERSRIDIDDVAIMGGHEDAVRIHRDFLDQIRNQSP